MQSKCKHKKGEEDTWDEVWRKPSLGTQDSSPRRATQNFAPQQWKLMRSVIHGCLLHVTGAFVTWHLLSRIYQNLIPRSKTSCLYKIVSAIFII